MFFDIEPVSTKKQHFPVLTLGIFALTIACELPVLWSNPPRSPCLESFFQFPQLFSTVILSVVSVKESTVRGVRFQDKLNNAVKGKNGNFHLKGTAFLNTEEFLAHASLCIQGSSQVQSAEAEDLSWSAQLNERDKYLRLVYIAANELRDLERRGKIMHCRFPKSLLMFTSLALWIALQKTNSSLSHE